MVLSTSNHMPHFKGVGWLLGSAYPGQLGNLVLFGDLDGPYSTFGRLPELHPSDEFSVVTDDATHIYRVAESYQTTPDDVELLAPTNEATATLITCSGHWNPVTQDYSHRLIIKATYLKREDRRK